MILPIQVGALVPAKSVVKVLSGMRLWVLLYIGTREYHVHGPIDLE